jgi:hypothetical protein
MESGFFSKNRPGGVSSSKKMPPTPTFTSSSLLINITKGY